MKQKNQHTRFSQTQWEHLTNLNIGAGNLTHWARDSVYRLFWNDKPEHLYEWSLQQKFKHCDWVTYSLAGRKFYDPIEKTKLGDNYLIGRFIQVYSKMVNWSNEPIYPIVWVSSPPKSLHFHALEFHNGIKPATRAKAFRNRFGTLTQLPKDLYKSVIKSTRTTNWMNCLTYGDRGHNQLITSLHKPRKQSEYPMELMGTMNSSIKGQKRMIEAHRQADIDFEQQLLAILNG